MSHRLSIHDRVSGKTRAIYANQGMPAEELTELINLCFSLKVDALRDRSNGTIYPIALVAKQPAVLAGLELETLTLSDLKRENTQGPPGLARQNATPDLHFAGRGKFKLNFDESDYDSEDESYDSGDDIDCDEEDFDEEEEEEEEEEKRSVEYYEARLEQVMADSDYAYSKLVDLEAAQRDAYASTRRLRDPLTLQESLFEIQSVTGLGDMRVLDVLRLLPMRDTEQEDIEGWPVDSLPPSVDRQQFLELMTDLSDAARRDMGEGAPHDEELLNTVFDVLSRSSKDFLNFSAKSRSLADTVDVSVLASALLLLCGSVESSSLTGVFLLYARRLTNSHWVGVAPEAGVYMHLSTCLRLAFQLCKALREAAGCSPEDMARRITMDQLARLPDRAYTREWNGHGILTLSEFRLCCVQGLQQGVQTLNVRQQHDQLQQQQEEEEEEEEEDEYPPLYDEDTHGRDFRARDDRDCADHHFPVGQAGVHFWEHESDGIDDRGYSDHHFPVGRFGEHIFHRPHSYYHSRSPGGKDEDESTFSGFDSNTNDAKAPMSAQSSLGGDTEGDASQASAQSESSPDGALEDSLVAASLVDFDGGPIELAKAQQLLGLTALRPAELLSALLFAASEEGDISLASYHRLMDRLIARRYGSLSVLKRSVVDYIVATLYATFTFAEEEGDGGGGAGEALHIADLGWGLLPFVGGEPEEKALVAAELLSTHANIRQQGGVTLGDMRMCLHAVLGGVRALNSAFLHPFTAAEVSANLADHAFKYAQDSAPAPSSSSWQGRNDDEDEDLVIGVAEFRHWLCEVLRQFDVGSSELDISRDSASGTTGSLNDFGGEGEGEEDAEELRSSVCSGQSTDSQSDADYDDYARALVQTARYRQQQQQQQQQQEQQRQQQQQQQQQQRQQQQLRGQSGYGSRGALFPADMDDSEPEMDDSSTGSASDMPSASQSTEDCYDPNSYGDEEDKEEDEGEGEDDATPASADESMLLEWEEARKAFQGGQPRDGVRVPSSSSAVVLELRGARAMLGLDGCPADDLMEILGEHSREGVLTLGRWLTALRHLVRLGGGDEHACHGAVVLGRKIFQQFEPIPSANQSDQMNYAVSYFGFATGLTCLCASSLDDKVSVAFTLLDDDQDGFVTQAQFMLLVVCTLRTIAAASAVVAARVSVSGLSLDDLAALVVSETCDSFGLEDGELMDKARVKSVCAHFQKLAQL